MPLSGSTGMLAPGAAPDVGNLDLADEWPWAMAMITASWTYSSVIHAGLALAAGAMAKSMDAVPVRPDTLPETESGC